MHDCNEVGTVMRALSVAIGVLLALAAGVYFLGPKIYVRYFLDDLN